jgi:hypothetical protein
MRLRASFLARQSSSSSDSLSPCSCLDRITMSTALLTSQNISQQRAILRPAPLISLRGIPHSTSDSGSRSDPAKESESDASSLSDARCLMRLASDIVVGNETYFLSCFLPFFCLFDAFFEVFLARFDGLLSWDESAGERAHLFEVMRAECGSSRW